MVDIPNDFVKMDLIKDRKDVKNSMVIRSRLADIIIRITPQIYRKHANTDKQGNIVLQVKLLKGIYRLMEASLMFYQILLKYLEAK